MSVYVDRVELGFGRMVMCHMIADTETELHEMADRVGVDRRWYQTQASAPHYDIALSKRALAVAAGAHEITWRDLALRCRDMRQFGFAAFPEWLKARKAAA